MLGSLFSGNATFFASDELSDWESNIANWSSGVSLGFNKVFCSSNVVEVAVLENKHNMTVKGVKIIKSYLCMN